jgi:hypothetical protein
VRCGRDRTRRAGRGRRRAMTVFLLALRLPISPTMDAVHRSIHAVLGAFHWT